MPISDEIKQQQKKLKNKSFTYKFKYIKDYYGKIIIISIIVLVFLIVGIKDWLHNARETVLSVNCINASTTYNEDFSLIDEFVAYKEIDLDDVQVAFEVGSIMNMEMGDQASMATSQKLLAMFYAKNIDIFIADEPVITYYSEANAFASLEDILPDNIKQEVSQYYYYAALPDGTSSPIGIYVNQIPKFKNTKIYPEENGTIPILTIAGSTQNLEYSIEFIRFLLDN